jgi:hypothetical protein
MSSSTSSLKDERSAYNTESDAAEQLLPQLGVLEISKSQNLERPELEVESEDTLRIAFLGPDASFTHQVSRGHLIIGCEMESDNLIFT